MRKVTKRVRDAFHSGHRLVVGNTQTDGESVWLFGNKIVERRSDGIYLSLAGWNTLTTRERLSGILGISVYVTKVTKGQAYVKGRSVCMPITPTDWLCITPDGLHTVYE